MVLRTGKDGFPELGMESDDIAIQERIALLASVACEIDPEAVADLLDAYNRVHTLGILDPSAYMRAMTPLEQRQSIAVAFFKFQKAALAFREAVVEAKAGE